MLIYTDKNNNNFENRKRCHFPRN